MNMYPPPNFRLVNDPNLKLNFSDNPSNICVNCYYYKNHDCVKFKYPDSILIDSDTSRTTCDYHFSINNLSNIHRKPRIITVLGLLFASFFIIGMMTAAILPFFNEIYGFNLDDTTINTIIGGSAFCGPIILSFLFWIISKRKLKSSSEKENNDKLANHVKQIDDFLGQRFSIPFTKVYETFHIVNHELVFILKKMPHELFDITNSEIQVNNHYRVQFLSELNSDCNNLLDEKEFEQFQTKLEENILSQPKSEELYCDKCGEEILKGQAFCPACGSRF